MSDRISPQDAPRESGLGDEHITRPRILDLFCGAGGAAMGYFRAGFDVVGVDIAPQPRYPFEFHQADAMTFPLGGFDVIHASPPCQAYSITKHSHSKVHPELVGPTREQLQRTGLPYVVENVVGAPLLNCVELCGASFGLEAEDVDGDSLVLRRHRLFETNWMVWNPPACACRDAKARGLGVGGVYGGGPSNRNKSWERGGYTPPHPVRAALMGIDWMNQRELCQAIPPAYTEWLGARLLEHLKVGVA